MLGLAPSASDADVRRAYHRLAREHHPDRHQGGDAAIRRWHEERMRAVNAAWEVLGDPARRRAHDRSAGHRAAAPPPRRPEGLGADLPDPDEDVLDASWVLSGERGGGEAWAPAGTAWSPTGTAVRRSWALGPAVVLTAGVLAVAVSLLLRSGALAVVGLLVIVAGAVGFGLVPLLVMSRQHQRRR